MSERTRERWTVGVAGPWLVCALVCLLATIARGEELLIAAASSLTDALQDAGHEIERQTPGLHIRFDFAASGILAKQIEQGGPFDLFISAGTAEMDELQTHGRLDAATRRNIASNRLVLISPAGEKLAGWHDLSSADVRRIAIGNPSHVPAGRYARQTLETLKLWDAVRPRLVLCDNVRQTLAYVETSNVDAGIVFRTDASVSRRVRIVATAETSWHDAIVYPAAMLTGSRRPETARTVLDRLASPEIQAVLIRHGFEPPTKTRDMETASNTRGEASPERQIDLAPLWLSLKVAGVATVVVLVVGTLAAWRLATWHHRGKAALETVLTLPLVLPPTVVGYYLLIFFGRGTAWGEWLNDSAGVRLLFTWQGAVIASAVMALPLMIKTTASAMESVDHELIEAARVLGAGPWAVLIHVLVPLSSRGILAGAVLAFARGLGEFGATLMVAGNIPGRTQTLPLALYDAVQLGDGRTAAAYGLALTAVCFVTLWTVGSYQWRIVGVQQRG